MINLIIESILFGFATYSILRILISKIVNQDNFVSADKVDKAAIMVVRIAGILFFIMLVSKTLFDYMENDSQYGRFGILNRMFGPHWIGYWMYPIVNFGLTQLLWINKFKSSEIYRIILSILLLLTFALERLLIIISSFQSDYIPSSWVYYNYGFSSNLFLNQLIEFSIFGLVVWTTSLLIGKNKNVV